MDAMKTHGAFSWTELVTTDPAAAATFYGELFGWNVKPPLEDMGGYRLCNIGEQGVAGIMPPPPGAPPMPPAWGCYVTVDDVEQTGERCKSLGGAVLVPPMEVPTVGRMAVLRDPQGAVFSIIRYAAG